MLEILCNLVKSQGLPRALARGNPVSVSHTLGSVHIIMVLVVVQRNSAPCNILLPKRGNENNSFLRVVRVIEPTNAAFTVRRLYHKCFHITVFIK